jgi:hypothetical protein
VIDVTVDSGRAAAGKHTAAVPHLELTLLPGGGSTARHPGVRHGAAGRVGDDGPPPGRRVGFGQPAGDLGDHRTVAEWVTGGVGQAGEGDQVNMGIDGTPPRSGRLSPAFEQIQHHVGTSLIHRARLIAAPQRSRDRIDPPHPRRLPIRWQVDPDQIGCAVRVRLRHHPPIRNRHVVTTARILRVGIDHCLANLRSQLPGRQPRHLVDHPIDRVTRLRHRQVQLGVHRHPRSTHIDRAGRQCLPHLRQASPKMQPTPTRHRRLGPRRLPQGASAAHKADESIDMEDDRPASKIGSRDGIRPRSARSGTPRVRYP